MDFKGAYYWTRYFSFTVSDRSQSYTLDIGLQDLHSTAGTSLDSANGMKFSSLDVDNDDAPQNCAVAFKRPFWNAKCGLVGPLSIYGDKNLGKGVYWQSVTGCCDTLDSIFFKTRPNHCVEGEGSACTRCRVGY